MGPALIEPDHSDADDAEGCARDAAMGPALIEPDHAAVWTGGGMANIAAMGPALIEPDHSPWTSRTPTAGSRRNGAGSHRAGSPGVVAVQLPAAGAAMGPALIEPDHLPGHLLLVGAHLIAAMGPALI